MQTHIAELTKQRLSAFFVKEDGHVAHKNALVAGAVATGALFASMLITPETASAGYWCGDPENAVFCEDDQFCCTSFGVAECKDDLPCW